MQSLSKMKFLVFTNNINLANAFDLNNNIETIYLDIERIGKEKRQFGTNSFISDHEIEDIKLIRPYIKKRSLGIRINPIHKNSESEINKVIHNGADVIMLPMFRTIREVNLALNFINDRAGLDLLVETPKAIEIIEELPLEKIRNIHFGINDLSLALKLPHMFNIFFNKILESPTKYLTAKNKVFGIGGVGAVGSKPFEPLNILASNFLLKSKRIILSRSFLKKIDLSNSRNTIFSSENEINKIFSIWEKLSDMSIEDVEKNALILKNQLRLIN